jgi:hypothetical protein
MYLGDKSGDKSGALRSEPGVSCDGGIPHRCGLTAPVRSGGMLKA